MAQTLDAAPALDLLPEGASIRLERGFDSQATGEKPGVRGLIPEISQKGNPAPVAATGRWIVERTNSWHNAQETLSWCTERRGRMIDLWVAFSDALILVGRLVQEVWSRYR